MIIKFGDKTLSFAGKTIFYEEPNAYPEKAVFSPCDLSTFAKIEHKTRSRFKGLQDNDVNGNDNEDRLIFIIRHSEREKTDEDTTGKDGTPDGVKGGLTKKGYEYAESAGKWFRSENNKKFALEDCAFYCTSSKRTWQTVQAFAKGMFKLDDYPTAKYLNAKNGEDAFKLDFDPAGQSFNYSWPACSRFADDPDNMEALDNTSKQIISNVLGMMGKKKFALCVSHDFNTLPLVSWACSQSLTNGDIPWNFNGGSSDKWLCYLAGVVIVVKYNTTNGDMIYVKPLYTINDTHQGVMKQGYENILK